ncbi:MAG: hypothetical protein JO165_10620 [Candidatus Eremiobacteraeota bacterium]|nr:hypothetical protein [Candidatus Eremiobacteraeota bacterium]
MILKELADLHDARQQRLAANAEPAVSPIQWFLLLFTGVLVVAFCYLFGVKHRVGHLVMTGGIAAAITCMLVLIFERSFRFVVRSGFRRLTGADCCCTFK